MVGNGIIDHANSLRGTNQEHYRVQVAFVVAICYIVC